MSGSEVSRDRSDPGGELNALVVFWHNSASWLVSALVHMILVLVLALLTYTLADKPLESFLAATIDGDEDVDTTDVLFDSSLDDVELDQSEALPVEFEAPGLAKLGEPTGIDGDVSDMGNVTLSSYTGDIGAPFGKDGDGFASAGDGTGGATFFGVKAGGRRFVFAVDGSKSMRRNGWEFCKRELLSAVGRLEPTQKFYVILFADKDYRMFGPGAVEKEMLSATPENIARLSRWLYSYELVLGTKPLTTMQFAHKLKPDAVYLLTDGQFRDGTVQFLEKSNKREDAYGEMVNRFAVHTIGFFSNSGQNLLGQISEDNGGTFRFVAPPPGFKPPPKINKPKPPGPAGNQPKKPGPKKKGKNNR